MSQAQAVSAVVERLGSLFVEEWKFPSGLTEQVEDLQIELEWMVSFLINADQKKLHRNHRVQQWILEVRDTAYLAEDVIEHFSLKVALRRGLPVANPHPITSGLVLIRSAINGGMNILHRVSSRGKELIEHHYVGKEIEAIKSKLSKLERRRRMYGIGEFKIGEACSSLSNERVGQLGRVCSRVHDNNHGFIGMDKNVKTLLERVIREEDKCRIIAVHGTAGLGKTTLVRMVYHHKDIKRRFEKFSWVYVSRKCETRNILEAMLGNLSSVNKEDMEKLEEDKLKKELHGVLQKKKCLVVLDDIWSKEDWAGLCSAFPAKGSLSKIILTTRDEEVASLANPEGTPYEPRILDDEESLELLSRKAIINGNNADFIGDSKMEARVLMKNMLSYCQGLPLFILVLGGILASKNTLEEWEAVHNTIKSNLRSNDLGLLDILASSYDELPYHLKPCFLYFGLFPEEFEISKKKLIQLWIAEGIVSRGHVRVEGEGSVEDWAECNLKELINRSMVEVEEWGTNGEIKTCRVHYLLRDVCLSRARIENFLCLFDDEKGKSVFDSTSSNMARRVSIVSMGDPCAFSQGKNPRRRSLLCFLPFGGMGDDVLKEMSRNFKFLRVIDLEGGMVWVKKLPKEVGNLLHLRYLNVRNSAMEKLPSSIENLKCLQTLDLRTRYHRFSQPIFQDEDHVWNIQMPNVVHKLEELRHLYLPKFYIHEKGYLQLPSQNNLLTLVNFCPERGNIEELAKCTDLKRLKIFLQEGMDLCLQLRDIAFNNMLSLSVHAFSIDLRGLSFCFPRLHVLKIEGKIKKLPKRDQWPPNLSKLVLKGSEMKEDPMPVLGKLCNLETFHLSLFNGENLICHERSFPKLKNLELEFMGNLREWRVDDEAMPILTKLWIYDCEKLQKIPNGLKSLEEFVTNGERRDYEGNYIEDSLNAASRNSGDSLCSEGSSS